MKKTNKEFLDFVSEFPETKKYLRIIGIGFASVIGIYLLGHILKISAHTVRGYNELKTAIKNG